MNQIKRLNKVGFFFLLLWLFSGCTRPMIKDRSEAMRLAGHRPVWADDLQLQGLAEGLKTNIQRLKEKPLQGEVMIFGPHQVAASDYLLALEELSAAFESDPTGVRFLGLVNQNFDVFEVYGTDEWGKVFITSYYEPVIAGSRKKTDTLTQPLYAVPDDMVKIRMDQFAESIPSLSGIKDQILEQKSRGAVLRGRLVTNKDDEGLPTVVPYYDRAEIDVGGALGNKKLELAWVDPIDAFFLHIQGSGVVRFADGQELRVSYGAQNGHPYSAIGRYLTDVIPLEKISLQTIEAHLRQLPATEMQEILNKNASYVFFRKIDGRGVTYFGTEVIPGRTIATDVGYFPKGALGFLEFEKPQFDDDQSIEPAKWQPASRFVLDQDTGGAIRGPGRLDLYWGRGPEAKRVAGIMKNPGKLYYLVPKADWLQVLQIKHNQVVTSE